MGWFKSAWNKVKSVSLVDVVQTGVNLVKYSLPAPVWGFVADLGFKAISSGVDLGVAFLNTGVAKFAIDVAARGVEVVKFVGGVVPSIISVGANVTAAALDLVGLNSAASAVSKAGGAAAGFVENVGAAIARPVDGLVKALENPRETGEKIKNIMAPMLDVDYKSTVQSGTSADDVLETKDDTLKEYLVGGKGNDEYKVKKDGVIIEEYVGEGVDTVKATVTYALPDNVENLILEDASDGSVLNIDGTGNNLNNTINGNSNANVLSGGGGDDTIKGFGGGDRLYGDDGNDTLYSSNVGDDYLYGGTGDDVYHVSGRSAFVEEYDDEGIDSVIAYCNYTLTDNVENLKLSEHDPVFGAGREAVGNGLNNKIVGNSFTNFLSGLAGDDYLEGLEGDDTLEGGDGNDTLDGGAGNDRLLGGKGDDTYIVDSLLDEIIEDQSDSGIDTVVLAMANFDIDSSGNKFFGLVERYKIGFQNSTIIGSKGGDYVVTNPEFSAKIQTLDGRDTVLHMGGSNSIHLGRGADKLILDVSAMDGELGPVDGGASDIGRAGGPRVDWTDSLILTGDWTNISTDKVINNFVGFETLDFNSAKGVNFNLGHFLSVNIGNTEKLEIIDGGADDTLFNDDSSGFSFVQMTNEPVRYNGDNFYHYFEVWSKGYDTGLRVGVGADINIIDLVI